METEEKKRKTEERLLEATQERKQKKNEIGVLWEKAQKKEEK